MTRQRLVPLPIVVTDESEAPRGADLYYRCRACQGSISSQPADSVGCACGNVSIEVDYHRLVVRDFGRFEVVRRAPEVATTDTWTQLPPNALDVEVVHKNFGDGPDVTIAIRRDGDGFVLQTSAETRTSGPNVTTSERTSTVDEARSKLVEECEGWDRDMDAPLDLSALRPYEGEPPN